jgi:hypothetical protein
VELMKIVWLDAADEERTWVTASEVEGFGTEFVEVESYGFVVHKTKHYVTLARDVIRSGTSELTYGGVCKVPRKMIKSITPYAPGDS